MEKRRISVINIILLIISFASIVIGRSVTYAESHYNLGIYLLQSGKISLSDIKVFSITDLLIILVIAIGIVILSRNTKIMIVASIVLLICCGLSCVSSLNELNVFYKANEESDIAHMRQIIQDRRTVVIGGGTVTTSGGSNYKDTNCFEAVQGCIESGDDIIELDLIETADGELVCSRLNEEYPEYIYGMPLLADSFSLHEFVEGKIYDEFTPLTFINVIDLMSENPTMRIVVNPQKDTIKIAQIISETVPNHMDRMIFEVFSEDEYISVRELGFKYIIFCYDMYENPDDNTEELKAFLEDNDVLGLMYWESWIPNHPRFHEAMVSMKEIPIYVHSVDWIENVDTDYEMGVDAFFTNRPELNEEIINE